MMTCQKKERENNHVTVNIKGNCPSEKRGEEIKKKKSTLHTGWGGVE